MNRHSAFIVVLLLCSAVFAQQASDRQEVNSSTIVFVCEHGAARSVIAAAHFNRMASEKGLPFRAVSRGKTPDEAIPAAIKDSLAADGLNVSSWKPKAISDADMQKAAKVVTLAVELPGAKTAAAGRLLEWKNVPGMNQSYDVVRNLIVQQVTELVQNLSAAKPR
jgi:arsenate reductase (thioredoxin)